jgi:hypothetical protein
VDRRPSPARERELPARLDGLDRRVRQSDGQRPHTNQQRNEETGLENQCREDSWDSIDFWIEDGPFYALAGDGDGGCA